MVSTEQFVKTYTEMALAGKTNEEIATAMGLKPTYVQSRASSLRVKITKLPKAKRAKRNSFLNFGELNNMVEEIINHD